MKELKKLNSISRDILEKEHHKKINSLCCIDEKKDAIKFLLLSHVKFRIVVPLPLPESIFISPFSLFMRDSIFFSPWAINSGNDIPEKAGVT